MADNGQLIPFGPPGTPFGGGGGRGGNIDSPHLRQLAGRLLPMIGQSLPPERAAVMARGDVARDIKLLLPDLRLAELQALNLLDQRDLVTLLINGLLAQAPKPTSAAAPVPPPVQPAEPPAAVPETADSPEPPPPPAAPRLSLRIAGEGEPKDDETDGDEPPPTRAAVRASIHSGTVDQAKAKIQAPLMERMDTSAAAQLPRQELARELGDLVQELLVEHKLQLNGAERAALVERLLDDMLGLGPLEPLLADEAVTDIMVNGANQVFVERRGKLELSDVRFRDNGHVMSIASRIVSAVGRRVDESSPLCDARLADGSRVNIIIPPLAIDGPSISIRKFSKKKITLDVMERQQNLSHAMATVLKVASRSRLNILISGGTGSGKTTLLNALSQMIDHGERVVTIEDAAELQLQQPHVVRLETRPANLEGEGEITMRELVKNALRMRPDRIILGEIRGAEALDMLQAMNTGHDGSLATVHANRPREALTRLENMVGMTGINLPSKAVRTQIASAVHMIVQISRMRDGIRRITHISEVVGMEGDIITMQDLFWFEYQGENAQGRLMGEFKSAGIRPHFLPRAEYYNLDKALKEVL